MATKTQSQRTKIRVLFKIIDVLTGFRDAESSEDARVFMVPTEDVEAFQKARKLETVDAAAEMLTKKLEEAYTVTIRNAQPSSTGKSWLFYKAAQEVLSL